VTTVRELFEDVIGCDDIVQKLEEFQNIAAKLKALGEDPKDGIAFNFLFRGPPGKLSSSMKVLLSISLLTSWAQVQARLRRHGKWAESSTTWSSWPTPRC